MEAIATFCFVLVMICLISIPFLTASHHAALKKEKARKEALMREYPHMAPQIYQSMVDEEARRDAAMAKALDGISQYGLNRAKKNK